MEDKTEIKKEETKVTRPSVYSEIHNRSFEELARQARNDAQKEQNKETPEKVEKQEEVEDKVQEKVKEVKEKKATERKEKIIEESVKAAKEAVIAEQKAKEEALKKEEDDKKAKEELEKKRNYQPKWKLNPDADKDDKGNPIPNSYDEIFEEAKVGAKTEILAELEEKERTRAAEEAKKMEEAKNVEEAKKQADAQLNQQIEDEYNELVSEGKLPAIKDSNNQEDEGVKAKTNLFKVGMEYNNERIKEGKRPIASLKLIYYEKFKEPVKQPAGDKAPIAGSSATTTQANNEPTVNYKDLHRMSYREIMMNLRSKMAGK